MTTGPGGSEEVTTHKALEGIKPKGRGVVGGTTRRCVTRVRGRSSDIKSSFLNEGNQLGSARNHPPRKGGWGPRKCPVGNIPALVRKGLDALRDFSLCLVGF
ncbi:hypothetical protein KIL84_007009 [Mauremys mutica]|uniref:Uncharacterized protein n=1 Tax=Mauremys mutica TaxID=74926 RepID=A0A9D4AWL0_9SAUR|nr:hypothetical protein KIL84_007009 [Mauremys mutica]